MEACASISLKIAASMATSATVSACVDASITIDPINEFKRLPCSKLFYYPPIWNPYEQKHCIVEQITNSINWLELSNFSKRTPKYNIFTHKEFHLYQLENMKKLGKDKCFVCNKKL
jgi:hypothetical protein